MKILESDRIKWIVKSDNDVVNMLLVFTENLGPGDLVAFIYMNDEYVFQRTWDGKKFIIRRYGSSHGISRECNNFMFTDFRNVMGELIIQEIYRL
jgi:hypothetical protein